VTNALTTIKSFGKGGRQVGTPSSGQLIEATREQPWGRDDGFSQAAAKYGAICKGSGPELNPISFRRCPTTAAKWRTRARRPQKPLTRPERESNGEIAPAYAQNIAYPFGIKNQMLHGNWHAPHGAPRYLLHTKNPKKKLRVSGFFYNFIVIFFFIESERW